MTFTPAAIEPPFAFATKPYSPVPRHVADALAQSFELSLEAIPFVKRGSKAHDAPVAIAVGAVKVWVAPPPNGVNVSDGVTAAPPPSSTPTLPPPLPFPSFPP